jgi:hypothetical protein
MTGGGAVERERKPTHLCDILYAKRIKYPTAMAVSSLNTYNSWEMAVARRPLPRMAVPVLVIKLGCDGSLSIISAARSAGGSGFEEDNCPAIY